MTCRYVVPNQWPSAAPRPYRPPGEVAPAAGSAARSRAHRSPCAARTGPRASRHGRRSCVAKQDLHALDPRHLTVAVDAADPAVAALAVTAERVRRVTAAVVVHPDRARLEGSGHPMRPVEVPGPDARG